MREDDESLLIRSAQDALGHHHRGLEETRIQIERSIVAIAESLALLSRANELHPWLDAFWEKYRGNAWPYRSTTADTGGRAALGNESSRRETP